MLMKFSFLQDVWLNNANLIGWLINTFFRVFSSLVFFSFSFCLNVSLCLSCYVFVLSIFVLCIYFIDKHHWERWNASSQFDEDDNYNYLVRQGICVHLSAWLRLMLIIFNLKISFLNTKLQNTCYCFCRLFWIFTHCMLQIRHLPHKKYPNQIEFKPK